MGKDPAIQFYVNDWLSSPTVMAMEPIQELAYFRMLLFCWASGDCSIPNDPERLGRLTRTDANTCSIVFEQAFNEHPTKPEHLTNRRLFELWEERQEFRRQRAEAGKMSGDARRKASAAKKNEQTRTRVPARSNKTRTKSNSSSSSSSSSSLLNPLTPFAYKGGTIDIPAAMNSEPCRQALLDWLDFKRSKGQAYKTPRSLQTAVRKWDRDIGAAQFPLAVEASIANNYAGLFPDKGNGKPSTNGKATEAWHQLLTTIQRISPTHEPDRLRSTLDPAILAAAERIGLRSIECSNDFDKSQMQKRFVELYNGNGQS